MWSEDNNAGAEAWNGALGVECKENKDCKSSIPDEGVAGLTSWVWVLGLVWVWV